MSLKRTEPNRHSRPRAVLLTCLTALVCESCACDVYTHGDPPTFGTALDGQYDRRESCEETLPAPLLCEVCICAQTIGGLFAKYCYDSCCVVGETVIEPGGPAGYSDGERGLCPCTCAQGPQTYQPGFAEQTLPDAQIVCDLRRCPPDAWTCPIDAYSEIVPLNEFDTSACDCGCDLRDPDCSGAAWFSVDDCDRWPDGCVVDESDPTQCKTLDAGAVDAGA